MGRRRTPLAEVFVLDSNTLGKDDTKIEDGTDEPQLRWIAEALRASRARWKVVAMHGTMVRAGAVPVARIHLPG